MPSRRREFLTSLSTLPLIGGLFACGGSTPTAATATGRQYLAELGVKPVINGAGAYTMFTGSLMQREVIDVIDQTSKSFVRLDELHDRVGEKIAALVGSEAAMVSSGCFGAMTCGTAACLTGTDPDKIVQIPDLTGMKSEVIVQKSHRFLYDHAVRNCGITMIEIESLADFNAAVSEKTAMMWFLNKRDPDGQIKHEQWVELGKKHGIPTMNDCAADVPPVENLTKYNKMGYDLVAFSGGKGICGPQSAGLLFGRKDLIQAARLNTYPNSDALGRGLKVNKEEIVGMWVALENYLNRDHKADWKEWERRAALISEKASAVEGVKAETFLPQIANEVPHVRISWDESAVAMKPYEVLEKLRAGEPSIELVPKGKNAESLEIASWMLQDGEAEIVADRVAAVLQGA